MPKTIPLTKANREQRKIDDICRCIFDNLRYKQVCMHKTDEEFADYIGISKATWRRWYNKENLEVTAFRSVIIAAARCGIAVQITPPERKIVKMEEEDCAI